MLSSLVMLDPKGVVALAERGLMIHVAFFMLIVAVPVFLLTFFFAWHYRAGNTKATYAPNWEHSNMEELIWWAIPFEIILIIGALTWTSTHQLDPRVPLSGGDPLVVEVVALDWKWLFIYPKEGIATVNYVRVPEGRPVRFEVTADAPMNSFWVPQLGGQIYAMTGMVNELNLRADAIGQYAGSAANYTGDGFAKMKFVVEATTPEDYYAWVANIQMTAGPLTGDEYKLLHAPSTEDSPRYFAGVPSDLYNSIVMQFMDQTTPAMDHAH